MCGTLLLGKLAQADLTVDITGFEKSGVGTQPGASAVVQNQNLVGTLYRSGALGYDKHRHAAGAFFDGSTQGSVGGVVQCRGTVVQNQDTGHGNKGPGNGQALTLPAGEIAPGGLHRGVQTARLGTDEICCLGNLQRGPDLLVSGIGFRPAHVVPDGPGKQNGFLGDNADQAPELGKPVFPDVVAEQRNLPGSGIVKAGDQVDQGGLAAARTTDDADGLAGGCVQGNVFQAGRTRTVVGKS